ncbi:MAG: hypothetical protein VYE77_08280 [Planctomycetota bacterium]|nr:hypothetical protein [Planctomycetota bacterium]
MPHLASKSPLLPAIAAISTLIAVDGAYAQKLDKATKAAIATFGAGVIEPIANDGKAIRIDKPLDYGVTRTGQARWKVVAGDQKGKTIERTVSARASTDGAKDNTFAYVLGSFQNATLLIENGSVYRNTEVNSQQGTISTFEPHEPVLLAGFEQGKPITMDLKVTVHPTDKPTKVKYKGTLKSTSELLGRFKVTTPAGVFDTIGIRGSFKGKVGPASIDDRGYVFYSKGVGPVAISVRNHVSAFLFHNETKKFSIVLASTPDSASPPKSRE